MNGLEQRSAEPLNHGTDDLIPEAVGIDDGAAFESLHKLLYSDLLRFGRNDNLRKSRDITALFVSCRQAKALALFRFLSRPTKGLRRRFQHRAQARLGKIFEAKLQWI